MIGGSLGLALSSRGWHVTGCDSVGDIEREALSLGVIHQIGVDKDAAITFVATPVSSIAEQVVRALAETTGLVTDVGGVKAHLVGQINDPRFIGGHPMAGSELIGLAGADAKLFESAVWVLTPSVGISDSNFEQVAGVVTELGSEIVVLDPQRHDQLVAIVSHLPAIGCPPINRASLICPTRWAFTPPTSVTKPVVLASARTTCSAIDETGVATNVIAEFLSTPI